MNPLNYINKWFGIELMNPNPKMTALKSGDRYTLTVEIDKETFDLFCDVGSQNRQGMVIEGFLKVAQSHSAVGEYDEDGNLIETSHSKPAQAAPGKGAATLQGASSSRHDSQGQQPDGKKGGPLAMLAARWVKDERFHDWVLTHYSGKSEIGEAEANHFVLSLCEIDSKKELDHNPLAAQRFHDLIRRPYWEHLQVEGGVARYDQKKTLSDMP